MRYAGMVKVVNVDGVCFPVDPVTLEPKGCSVYDTHPLDEPEAREIISTAEWNNRRAAMASKAEVPNG